MKIILDDSGGPKVTTREFRMEDRGRQSQRDAVLLASKMEEGASSQEMWMLEKTRKWIFSWSMQEHGPVEASSFKPVRLMSVF
jgi:hypothetical protein